MRVLTIVLFTACLLFASDARADSIRLRNGVRIEGAAEAYDGNTQLLTWRGVDGPAREYKLEDLDTRSAYRVLKGAVPKDSGKGQLQLANFARDIEYFAHAARHYGYAREAAPELGAEIDREVATLKARAADWGMKRAQEYAKQGDLSNAEKWLRKVITKLPDQPEAAQAQAMIDEYYDRVRAERTARVEAEAAEHLRKDLAGARQAYDSMLEKNHQALTTPKGGSKSVKSWESAIRDGEKALREIDRFQKKHAEVSAELLDEYRGAVHEGLNEVYLHLANHWATRNSYNKALVQVNAVLAVDPEHEEARSLRNRILDASSRGIRWFW